MRTVKAPAARQLPSGSWFCRMMVDGQTICITRPTKAEAEKEALAVKMGLVEKESRSGATLTVSEAIDRYIESNPSLSPSTVRGYRRIQANRMQPLMHRRIDSLSDSACQKAINAESVEAKTVHNAWGLVAAAIKKESGCSFDVVLPKRIKKPRQFLEPDEVKKFIAVIHGDRYELAMLLALHSLRRSEILGMRWPDIDTKARLLHVHGSRLVDEHGKLVYSQYNKTVESRRDIPIMIDRVCELTDADDKSGEFAIACSPDTLRKHINRICRASSLPEVGLHGLRHSFCSLGFYLGVDEKTMMQLGGWSDYQTMRNIYQHIAKKGLAESAAKLTAFLNG